jgi:hypothetical protein
MGGDMFKTVYFLHTGAPVQFLVCGILQLLVDVMLAVQLLVFSDVYAA